MAEELLVRVGRLLSATGLLFVLAVTMEDAPCVGAAAVLEKVAGAIETEVEESEVSDVEDEVVGDEACSEELGVDMGIGAVKVVCATVVCLVVTTIGAAVVLGGTAELTAGHSAATPLPWKKRPMRVVGSAETPLQAVLMS